MMVIMKLQQLSTEAQDGLRRFCLDVHKDELMLDDTGSSPERWAWFWFQLRLAPDRPEWFPKGKWATIQAIEERLSSEAHELIKACGVEPDAAWAGWVTAALPVRDAV